MKKLITLLFAFTLFFLAGCEDKTFTLKEGTYYDKNNMHNGSSLEFIDLKDATTVERTTCGADAGCSLFKGTYVVNDKTLTVILTDYSDEIDGWTALDENETLEYTISNNNEFTKDTSIFVLKEKDETSTNTYDIKLENKNESFDFDKLHLEFTGSDADCEECYFYDLTIKYDGKEVGKGFFNDEENSRVFSTNMAASFVIHKIDNVYVVISSIASQCYGRNILIFNTEGKTLEMFSSADINVEDHNIHVEVSPSGNCMGDPEIVRDYEIKGLELIKK